MLTPQSNADLGMIAAEILSHETFVICGHVNPDGDCIGSQTALCLAIRKLGKRCDCLLVSDDAVPQEFGFLKGTDGFVRADAYLGDPEVFIACDVPNTDRIGAAAAAIQARCASTITIDHHASPTSMSKLNHVDPDAAAAAVLVWELVGMLGIEADADIAQACFAGMMTDTGRFQFQNTDERVLSCASQALSWGAKPSVISENVFYSRSLASLELEKVLIGNIEQGAQGRWTTSFLRAEDFTRTGATKDDIDPFVDILRSVRGSQACCLLKETDGVVRGSFRAKGQNLDVAALARSFGGGGHKAAAGFTSTLSIDETLVEVHRLLDGLFADGGQDA